jgi:C4-dicarboxylate transporter DctM subunit
MDPIWLGLLGVILMLLLLCAGVHIALSLAFVGICGLIMLVGFSSAMNMMGSGLFHQASQYAFVVIPLFVFMGMIASGTGISENVYRSAQIWTGAVRGGLGIATVAACTAFGSICGSSLVTAAVFARISAPEMRRLGYEKRFSYGICSSGGVIGMLIPPSVLFVIYGLITEVSIGKLLIAGILPGLILFLFFSLGISFMVKLKPSLVSPIQSHGQVPLQEKLRSLVHFVPVALTFLIISGGIFTGIFSPSEAGAVACLALIIWFFLMRLPLGKLWSSVEQTMLTVAMVFFILISAALFARFLNLSGVANKLTQYVVGSGFSPLGVMLASLVLYLVLGCFLDSISMLSITLPVIFPITNSMGIDPIYYAVVVVMTIEAGLITPPVGLNIYAVKGVAEEDVSLEDLFIGAFPFLIMMIVAIFLFIAFPALSMWLPNMMF